MWAMAPLFLAMKAGLALLTVTGSYTSASSPSTSYSSDLIIAGGNGVYSNPQVASGSLPTGLSLSIVGSNLRLSGTTGATSATYTFTVSCQSGDGQTATSASQSITIANTDPNFASVLALLHFDGTNGGTVFTDQIGKTWTATSATTSSTQAKFGATSGSFASGYLQAANDANFAFPGQFTIECWVYITSTITSGTPRNIFQVGGSSNHQGMSFGLVNNACRLSAPFVVNLYQGTTNVIPINQWVHLAMTRDASNVIRSFINGVADTVTKTDSTNMTPASTTGSYMSIGGGQTDAQVLSFPGYIDDLRITKGVCRYSSNFTPPAAPFPDS